MINRQMMNQLVVGLVVVVALASSCHASISIKKVQNVLDKLEAYATAPQAPARANLNIKELEEAFAEFQTWDSATRQRLVGYTPLMQLMTDFLFYPMERFYELVGDTEEEYQAYIDRLAETYRKFRPSYLGGIVGTSVHANPKTTALISSLVGIRDPKPLTIKLIREGKMEFDAFVAKMGEIPDYEDVYADPNELLLYRNYYNQNEVQLLKNVVFPALPTLTDDQLPALKELYVEELRKKGTVVHNGELVRIG